MPGSVQVIEEAEVDRPRQSRADRPWLLLLATFAVGVLAGAVFFGPVVAQPTGPTVDDSPATPLVPGEEADAVGIARAVAGFEDALVAIVESQPGFEYLLWPVARGPNTRGIPVRAGDAVTVDRSGAWIAALSNVPDTEGGVLSLGRSNGMAPVVSGVDSYAWHDSAPGRIGFLRFHEGSWGLYEASAYPIPELRVDLGLDRPGSVLAYGDWGWALSTMTGFEVVNETGTTSYQGQFLDSRQGEFLVLRDDALVIEGGLTDPVVLSAAPILIHAALSPDGSKVAIVGLETVTVIDRTEGAPVVRHPAPRLAAQVLWAGERFVAVPAVPRGLTLIDLEGNTASTVLSGYTVHWAGIIPISGRS